MKLDQTMESVFAKQKALKNQIALTSASERKVKLEKLKQAILANLDLIAKALHQDLAKPMTDEPAMEAGKVIHDIDYAIANLDGWMQPTAIEVQAVEGAPQASIKYEARGQVLIMSAWNFPFSLALSPLVPAIAAGNTACIKTNDMAPATAEIVKMVIAEAFAEDEVAVFTGDVNEAIALQSLPFDHVFFTGSPSVGKTVMSAAAKNLTSVTLELGGKCPAVVGRMDELQTACANIAIGRTFNLGQTCLCVDYAIVPEEKLEEFVAGVGAVLEATYYSNGEYQAERNSRIIDRRNFLRLKSYLDDAISKGAEVVFGGACDEEGLVIEPTILTRVSDDALIMENEIFGPILPVLTYQTLEDVVGIVNDKNKPLGLYIFSDDDEFTQSVLDQTSSGGVSVNGWANHYFESGLPFGGVNHSGMGCYHGEHGFKELSHARAIYKV
ncbi:MAG: aldehyde dehydrogenase family protein [Spongiibacteraceae bacterium]|nr:aldehyde dehydrogenase family protein [Spongiibacteraceae bacterium]